MKNQLIISVSILVLLLLVTTLVVLYGRGYRLQFANGKAHVSGTGLLVTASIPTGAEVFINDHLTTATDNTINLLPGEYEIKIHKDGYFTWQKKMIIQKEVVSQAEALLFPTAPKLENITTSGVLHPILDPTLTQVAYMVSSQSARKNGIYVLDMNTRPILSTARSALQIANNTFDAFSQAEIEWSPDGKEMLATISSSSRLTTTYLLQTNTFNDTPQDVTQTITLVRSQWEQEKKDKEVLRLTSLKAKLSQIITNYFEVIAWSPDETKILYTASASGTIPIILKPRLVGTNSTPEDRILKEDGLYVYDIKEDKNYNLQNIASPLMLKWFSDSSHLMYVHEKKIDVLEYDGSNLTTVYAGPFEDSYAYPWPNASKIVILTNLNNPTISPNLYTIELK